MEGSADFAPTRAPCRPYSHRTAGCSPVVAEQRHAHGYALGQARSYRRRQGVRRRATGGRHVQQPRNSPAWSCPRPGSSTGTTVSSAKMCAETSIIAARSRATTGATSAAAYPIQNDNVARSRMTPSPGHHLRLPIQRLMPSAKRAIKPPARPVPRSGGRLRSAPHRRGRLHHVAIPDTGSTGELRSPGHDHPGTAPG